MKYGREEAVTPEGGVNLLVDAGLKAIMMIEQGC